MSSTPGRGMGRCRDIDVTSPSRVLSPPPSPSEALTTLSLALPLPSPPPANGRGRGKRRGTPIQFHQEATTRVPRAGEGEGIIQFPPVGGDSLRGRNRALGGDRIAPRMAADEGLRAHRGARLDQRRGDLGERAAGQRDQERGAVEGARARPGPPRGHGRRRPGGPAPAPPAPAAPIWATNGTVKPKWKRAESRMAA